jgi:hypothetical protein
VTFPPNCSRPGSNLCQWTKDRGCSWVDCPHYVFDHSRSDMSSELRLRLLEHRLRALAWIVAAMALAATVLMARLVWR